MISFRMIALEAYHVATNAARRAMAAGKLTAEAYAAKREALALAYAKRDAQIIEAAR